jgi:hypothetical protein
MEFVVVVTLLGKGTLGLFDHFLFLVEMSSLLEYFVHVAPPLHLL